MSRSLRVSGSLLILYAFVAYVSWQLHELGHWVVCKLTGVEAVFGFNE